ncbi:MAG TPA: DciA family protein [Rhodocyclaceae bacterium]
MPELRPLDACIQGAPTLSQVLAHAKLLARAQQILASVAPAALVAASRVANIRRGELIIHADNGAVAVKIRQIGARLCRELSFQGIDCTAVNVVVQDGRRPVDPPAVAVRALSEGGRASLSALAEGLPDGDPLRQRLSELLARSARPEGE